MKDASTSPHASILGNLDNEQTPMHLAARDERIEELVLVLENNGVSVDLADNNGRTPMHYAALYGQVAVLDHLMAQGTNINPTDNNGRTPMHYAAEHGRVAVIELLATNGADVDQADNDWRTPMHFAAEYGQVAVLQWLIDQKVDVNQEDIDGRTPMHFAAEYGQVAVLKWLVTNGANINQADHNMQTPLELACHEGQVRVIRFLITEGVDINIKNSMNKSIYESYTMYFNKEFLLPIFKRALDVGNVKVLINLSKCQHYRTEIFKITQNSDFEYNIKLDFSAFLYEFSLIRDSTDKINALNNVLMRKLKMITSGTTTTSRNYQLISKIINFFEVEKEPSLTKILHIVDIGDIIIRFMGWQKQWICKPLQVDQNYQSINDIITLAHARGTDIALILNTKLDAYQHAFQFSSKIRGDILTEFPKVLGEEFAIDFRVSERFARDNNKVTQFIWLKIIAKTLLYNIIYYSDADSIIHFSGGDDAQASFKIYETPEGQQLISALKIIPKKSAENLLKRPHDDNGNEQLKKASKIGNAKGVSGERYEAAQAAGQEVEDVYFNSVAVVAMSGTLDRLNAGSKGEKIGLLCIEASMDPSYVRMQAQAFNDLGKQLSIAAEEFGASHQELVELGAASHSSGEINMEIIVLSAQNALRLEPTIRYFFNIAGIELPKMDLSSEAKSVLDLALGVLKTSANTAFIPEQALQSGSYYAGLKIYEILDTAPLTAPLYNLISFTKNCGGYLAAGSIIGLGVGSPFHGAISSAAMCLDKHRQLGLASYESPEQADFRLAADAAAAIFASSNGIIGMISAVVLTDITAKVASATYELGLNGLMSYFVLEDDSPET